MNRRLTTVAVLFLLTISAFAQDTPAPRDTAKADVPFYELNEVVVSASRSSRPILRVPMAIDVIGMEDIQRSRAAVYFQEILRSIPGVAVDNRYTYSWGEKLIIRGLGSRARFGVRGMKIFMDGIPLTTPDGSAALREVNIDALSRVEVIRGPVSSLYGNASMGVLNLTSAIDPNTPVSVQTKVLTGSYGLQKWEGSVLGSSGMHGYSLNFNRTKVDGYRTNSAALITRVGFLGTHQLSRNIKLISSINYFDAPYMLTPGSLSRTEADTKPESPSQTYFLRGAGTRTDHWLGGLTMKYIGESNNSFDATAHYMKKHQFNSSPADLGTRDFSMGGFRFIYRDDLTVGSFPANLSVGADVELYDEEREQFPNQQLPPGTAGTIPPDQIFDTIRRGAMNESQKIGLTGVGPFVELELELSPAWILSLGSRYDYYSITSTDRLRLGGIDNSGERTMTQFSPSIGLVYRMYEFASVYGNVSTAFQIPTTSELRNREGATGGLNQDLNPERVVNIEAGLKGVIPESRFVYDLSVFYVDYTDMLISYQSSLTLDTYYRNAGKARNIGAEGRLQWEPIAGLRGSLTYTKLNFIYKDFIVEQTVSGVTNQHQLSDNDVPSISPNRLNFSVSYRHPVGLFTEINVETVDKYFANDFNGPAPGVNKPESDYLNTAYTNVDCRAGFIQSLAMFDIELFVGVNNLFNKKYVGSVVPNGPSDRFFEPAPPRNWYGGLRINFKAAK